MEKLKKATKRIAAVGAATVLVTSTAFGAGLGNYPSNFVQDGQFNGKVVVGAAADSIDTTSANSVIDDLKADFSGESEKVKITYKDEDEEGGETVNVVDSRDTLNFGENLAGVREDLDDGVTNLLEDGDLDNDVFNQELFLENGAYEYRIFDEVDGEDTAKDGLYYNAYDSFAKYVLTFEDVVDISGDNAADLKGEEITIMGNEFTVEEIDEKKLTLIGGSNKISVGEGESVSTTVDGENYDVEVLSVSSATGGDKVLLSVNGQTKTIDELDSETMGGVTVAVTELVPSSRDSVKGYAEIVIGGQKVELTDSDVKINDEDLDDVYDEYNIDVEFDDNEDTFDSMTITYKVDENTVLSKGDSLKDVLFNAFELSYDGMNDVEYSTFEISTADNGVTFDGNLYNGDAIPSEFEMSTDDEAGSDLYLGSRNKRVYFNESDLSITDLIDAERMRGITLDDSATTVAFNVSAATTDVKDNMFFSRIDDDEFYMYKITGVDKDDSELDFEDLLTGKSTNAVDYNDIQDSLEFVGNAFDNTSANGGNESVLNVSNLGAGMLHLENGLEMDFSEVEVRDFTNSADSVLNFSYNDDVDMDDNDNESDSFTLNFKRADDADDSIKIGVGADDFVYDDETEDNSDYDVYVDHYGTMLTLESDDNDHAEIKVPEEEVHGQVSVVFGERGTTQSVTVDKDAVEDKKAELEEDGKVIVDEETVESEEVEFDVEGVTLDSDVEATSDMIVVGGPAVNEVARELLGIEEYSIDQAGVAPGEGVVKYFEDSNSVLVYGYSGEDTAAAVAKLNAGGLSGDEETI